MLFAASTLSSTTSTRREADRATGSASSCRGSGRAGVASAGSLIVNWLPCPTPRLSTATSPPCISISRRTSVSPMPKRRSAIIYRSGLGSAPGLMTTEYRLWLSPTLPAHYRTSVAPYLWSTARQACELTSKIAGKVSDYLTKGDHADEATRSTDVHARRVVLLLQGATSSERSKCRASRRKCQWWWQWRR
jgi:hypothetical protein